MKYEIRYLLPLVEGNKENFNPNTQSFTPPVSETKQRIGLKDITPKVNPKKRQSVLNKKLQIKRLGGGLR